MARSWISQGKQVEAQCRPVSSGATPWRLRGMKTGIECRLGLVQALTRLMLSWARLWRMAWAPCSSAGEEAGPSPQIAGESGRRLAPGAGAARAVGLCRAAARARPATPGRYPEGASSQQRADRGDLRPYVVPGMV